jgi:hypothetical protein
VANLFFPRNLLEKIKKDKIVNYDTKSEYNYLYNQNIELSMDQKNTYDSIKKSDNKKVLLY